MCLQPFLGIGEASNKIHGKIKMGGDTLATIDGHWDQDIYIKDKATGVCTGHIMLGSLILWISCFFRLKLKKGLTKKFK